MNTTQTANASRDRLTLDRVEEEVLVRLERLAPGLRVLRTKQTAERSRADPDLMVEIRRGDVRKTLLIEVKSSGEPAFLHGAINRLHLAVRERPDSYPVVVAPYVSARGREILRQSRVGFLDLTGNCLLEFDGVYIERTEPTRPPTVRRQQRSLFAPVSSRIHRVLLHDVEHRRTLRDLAREAGVSLGLAHRVIQRLLVETFVEKQDRLLVLRDASGLLDAWRDAYRYSTNTIRTFHAASRTPQQLMERVADAARRIPGEYAFTMHAGASLVAPFVRFTDVHVYTGASSQTWIEALDLREVEFGGNFSLVTPYDPGVFYAAHQVDGAVVASDVQLYLDLYHYPARGREQADFLRERRLKF